MLSFPWGIKLWAYLLCQCQVWVETFWRKIPSLPDEVDLNVSQPRKALLLSSALSRPFPRGGGGSSGGDLDLWEQLQKKGKGNEAGLALAAGGFREGRLIWNLTQIKVCESLCGVTHHDRNQLCVLMQRWIFEYWAYSALIDWSTIAFIFLTQGCIL